MKRNKRNRYSAEFNAKVALAALKEDATEFVGVMLGRVDPCEDDGLIGPHPGRLVDGRGIQPTMAKILLGPDDEEGRAIGEGMKPFEVQISAVHHVVRSRLGDQFVQDVDVVPLSVGDLDERGDVPPQIQEGVEFDGRLPFPESRPRKEGEAKIDGRGIEGIHRLFQFHRKGIVRIQVPCGTDQYLGEVGVDSPVAVLVGVGQRVPGDPSPDAHVVQLGANGPRHVSMSRRLSRKVNWAKAMQRNWSRQEKLKTL